MQLKEVMTRQVEVIHPDATLGAAAERMRTLDVGALPVCDGDQLVGVITDRDITIRATAEQKSPQTTKVRDVMTPEVVYGLEDQDVMDAARIMEERQIRRLPVLDKNHKLVGIVALGDLATDAGVMLGGEILEQVSEPSHPDR